MVTSPDAEGLTWYSIQSAAEILQRHPNTIRARIRTGKIPSRQIELSGKLVYEVGILDDDAAAADSEHAREAAAARIEDLLRENGRLETERDLERAENARLRDRTAELEGQVATLSEDLITVRSVSQRLEEEREGARRRHEELAVEHGTLQSEYEFVIVRYQELIVRANRAFFAIAEARESYLGRGVLPWLRRRFSRFAGFDDITEKPLLLDFPRRDAEGASSELSSAD